jgi:hypothetical protein
MDTVRRTIIAARAGMKLVEVRRDGIPGLLGKSDVVETRLT